MASTEISLNWMVILMAEMTERDLRMPEFYHLNAEDLDDYEFRGDGQIVRKDRWEMAIHEIRSAYRRPLVMSCIVLRAYLRDAGART